jgi:hypothetical protein
VGPPIILGAGAVWVFTRNGTTWSQQGSKLTGSGAVGAAQQGTSVSVSANGNTIAVGGLGDNSFAGATWIFTRNGTAWSQQGGKLVGTGATGAARQGCAVSLSSDGCTLIFGGYNDATRQGAAWVFTQSGGVWTQQGAKLVGSGASSDSYQGWSVALSANGNTAAIGGTNDNTLKGAVWIFTRSSGVWSQQGNKLVGTGAVGNARQGGSVAVSADGNALVEGGYGDDANKGAMWVFTRSGSSWTQQGSKGNRYRSQWCFQAGHLHSSEFDWNNSYAGWTNRCIQCGCCLDFLLIGVIHANQSRYTRGGTCYCTA